MCVYPSHLRVTILDPSRAGTHFHMSVLPVASVLMQFIH